MPALLTPQRQWPRGPSNSLHKAVSLASPELTLAVLCKGSIDIDQGNPDGFTPLMMAAAGGHSCVARILLDKGANVSITADSGFTALHCSSQRGRHLAVTKMLAEATADLDATDWTGFTPLDHAANKGHWEIASILLEAGANPDTRLPSGSTPLFNAAYYGHTATVRVLLRGKANPLLSKTASPQESSDPSFGKTCSPLDAAAQEGHPDVIRELIQHCGVDGCGGTHRGRSALRRAAQKNHVDVLKLFSAAGVADDTGAALQEAAQYGSEASVKFLLQQQRQQQRNAASAKGLRRYANVRGHHGATPLSMCLGYARSSPRVARLLIDAGADTSMAVKIMNMVGEVFFNGTPLDFATFILRNESVHGPGVTEEQLNKLEATRRLLLQIEAVHAVSWLWPSDAPPVVHAAGGACATGAETNFATAGPALTMMLPVLRRRARRTRVLLAPLFRYSAHVSP